MIKINNAKLADNSLVDLEINNGVISKLSKSTGKQTDGIDATGKLLLPGLVDLHTHLREPGREDSETVLTGSQAAVAGGYTAISSMANTNPVADTAGVVEQIFRLGKTAEALALVNQIRARAGNLQPFTTLTADNLYAERGRELWWEGWRRNDAIRFGKFLAARGLKPYTSDKKYLLYPIPADALFNSNLTQNPGY